jgi:hypothetical protein
MKYSSTNIKFVLSFLVLDGGRLVKLFYNISKGLFRTSAGLSL